VLDFRHMVSETYEITAMSEAYSAFAERHNIHSAPKLTVIGDEMAELVCQHLAPRIAGRTVVEIGGGIGLLSLAMASVAKRVFCIGPTRFGRPHGRRFCSKRSQGTSTTSSAPRMSS